MFDGCEKFNQDLSKWDVSKVKFKICTFINCPIEDEFIADFNHINHYNRTCIKIIQVEIKCHQPL